MSGIFDQVINYAPPSLLKGTVTYKGTWSAATNTPTLINPPDSTTNGFYYVVSAAGTQFSLVFNIGDWIISNGSAWEKVDNTDAVSSVFGRTGAVVGVSTDYSAVGITATAVGASSPSTGAFTTLSATTPLAVASGGTGVASSTGTTNVVLSGSPTITTPVIAQINDANGNETLKLASIASAVNEVTIENAATGNAVHISATGGDASVGLHLAGKGASGYVNVQDSTDATKRIMFNAAGGTTNTRTMLSSTQTVDRTLSLPDATDTLVGKATTDTLTNKTLTSPTITGGALNGTLGATTPSTVAATTLTTTGAITSTATGDILGSIAATTTEKFLRLNNTSGATKLGTESSAGATIFLGTTAYASVFGSPQNNPVQIASNNSVVATFTSTGLNSTAIGATTVSTGAFSTLSATGDFIANSGSSQIVIGTGGNTNSSTVGMLSSNSVQILLTGNTYYGTGADRYSSTNYAGASSFTKTTGIWNWSTFASGTAGNALSAASASMSLGQAGLAVTGTLSATGLLTTTLATGGQVAIFGSGNTTGVYTRYSTSAGTKGFIGTGDQIVSAGNVSDFGIDAAAGNLLLCTADVTRATVSSTGLAVTGVVTATGDATFGGSALPSATVSGVILRNPRTVDDCRISVGNISTSSLMLSFYNTNGRVGDISTNGSATSFNTSSDYRLKNITGSLTDSGTFIDALKPKAGTWKADGSKFVGFLAHEFAEVSPSSVSGEKDAVDADGKPVYQSMQAGTSEVIANLVAELQSLRKRLAALESK